MGNSADGGLRQSSPTPSLDDALYLAARGGRLQEVRALLDAGADPNSRGGRPDGRTPLMGSAFADAWEIAQLLLERGARLEPLETTPAGEPDGDGCSALMIASQRDAQAVAGVLLHAGADPDAATARCGQTALMWCCQGNLARMASLLLAAGARVDRRRRNDSATPLMLAARNDAAEVADLLLELGAPPDDRGPAGFTALMVCGLVDAIRVAGRLLAARADKSAADGAGRTALHVCARHGSLRVARLLLDAGADASAVSGTGAGCHTPATLAAAGGRFDLLRLLVKRGADYRHKCADGRDLCQLAKASGCRRTAKLAVALMGSAGGEAASTDRWLHTQADGSLQSDILRDAPPLLAALLRSIGEAYEENEDDEARPVEDPAPAQALGILPDGESRQEQAESVDHKAEDGDPAAVDQAVIESDVTGSCKAKSTAAFVNHTNWSDSVDAEVKADKATNQFTKQKEVVIQEKVGSEDRPVEDLMPIQALGIVPEMESRQEQAESMRDGGPAAAEQAAIESDVTAFEEATSVATSASSANSLGSADDEAPTVIEQLIIKKKVVTTETSGDRVVSVREQLLEITVDCGKISETVRVKGGDAAALAAARGSSDLRSTGSQFYPMADDK